MTLNMPDPWKSHSATHRTKGSSTPVPNATQWSAGDFHAVAVQCMYCTSQTFKLQLRCLWGTNIYLYIRIKKQHIVFFFLFYITRIEKMSGAMFMDMWRSQQKVWLAKTGWCISNSWNEKKKVFFNFCAKLGEPCAILT